MDISYGDDCSIPLDAVRDGFDVVHAKDAVTYDYMAHEANQELKAKVRIHYIIGSVRGLSKTY